MKNFNNFNNLISLADVMSRSSRRTDNLLSNKDATRQKDGKKTATTRQRCTMSHQGYLKNLAMIFAVLVMSMANVGQMWGAISEQDVPSSTFTCGTTSGYATYFYTFSSDAANSDTIVFSAYDSYDSSITWASYTGDHKGSSASWKDKIYAAASGTSEVDRNATPTGLAHKVYNSGNYYYVRSNRTLRYLVTNCTGVMISGYVSNGYTLYLKAYLVTNGTPAASAAQTASITSTSQTTTSISGLTASNTYLIEISGSAEDNKHMVCEVAFIYPHASSCSDDTGLAYGTGTVNKTYGDASFTNTLTNSNSLSVTYSSSNTNVATVNSSGAVTIKAAGTTNITATWAGNATYCADAVSYTLNVKPAVGSVSGAWDRFGGETISLSVTPSGGSSYTYQWQKYNGSGWDNVSNGTVSGATTTGATSANLQIANCGGGNSGTYRCQVTAGDQTNETDGRQVKVYVLECYNSGTTVYNFTRDGNNQRGSLTIDLAASTNYGFKVHADNDYYGNNGTVYEDVTNWVCSTDQAGNLTIAGGLGGTFTITMDYSSSVGAAAEGIPEVSVTYPRKTVYLKPNSDWKSDGGKFAFYYYREVGETTYGTGWTDFLSASVCDGDVYPATIPQWSGVKIIGVRFNSTKTSTGNWDDNWNQTDDLTLTSNDLVEITGWSNNQTYNSTYDAPEYTISFAANGGSGSMSSISSIACDADQQITANSFTKTGYSFAGWKADVNVKIGGETISAGTVIANSATIQNIRGNIALTAQWTEDKHSVTVAAGSNGTVSPTSVSNIGIATASGDITATPNTGYHFTSWTLPSGTSAASTYSETSNPIHINATADDKTITANFSANTPTITLDDQEATNTPTGSVVATYGSSMPEIATLPTKTGYTFGGFYSAVAGGGTKYYTNTGASAKNSDLASATTLYALWTQSVKIDDNGGSADGSVSVTYNGTAGTPSVPTYAGHTVDLGYYAESSCTNKVMNLNGSLVASVTVSTVPWTNSSSKWIHAGASTLYAHWKCNTPEISCSSNTVTITVPSGATVYYTTTTDGSTPADPTSSSTAYNPSSKPTISADTKIKAIAIQSGCTNSDVASATLTYEATGDRYYLFTPTSAPVHGGVLSGQFVTDGSKQDQEKTILGYTFPSYIKGVGTATSMSGRLAGSQGIQYYAKTSNTKFIIYYGVSSSSSTYSIHIGRVSEGETSVTSVSRSVSANDLDTIQYEYTNSKNTTFSFHINNNNIWIYQIVVIESGTDHKQAGEAGYDLSFNKGRIALKSDKTITAEGLTIKSGSNFSYTNSTALSMAKNDLTNNQISFTTPASPGDLKLTWSGGQMALNTSASADGATNVTSGTAYSLSGSTKYYLINTGGSASSVTKLQFVTAASTHSVTVEYNGSGSYGTASAASTTVGEGSTTTITATPETGYQVTNWAVSGTGSSISPSGASNSNTTTLTMGTADATVTCTFGAISYTLSWSSNGGSELTGSYTSGSTAYGASITAPTDPTLSNYTFDGWKTNNDGTGTAKGSTMPAANTTYYAAWKQTVTLTTGAQGSGGNQTPYVYLNGTGVSSFTAHTATGYTLQGYYTAGSGGTKVLNADGTFAAANVTDYITSSKWSRTGAAPTLYAQWVASEDCSTSDFVIKTGTKNEYKGCMDSTSYNGTKTSFTAGSATTVGNAKMTISHYSSGAIVRPGSGNTFSIVIEPVSGYYLKSVCWAGKVENDETVSYYWDNNSGSATTITPTTTSGTGVTYDAPNSTTTKFTASYTDDGDGSGGIWWRNVQVEVCAGGGTTYNVTYDDNGSTGGTAPTDNTNYSYGDAVTVLGNTGSLAKTNYSFVGWSTNDDGTGSNYVADNTFSITANTTLYAKWTQSVTLDKNGGSTDGSATAVWNATGLTGITHAKPAAGYKLLGYYSAPSDGTKVLNSDGSFAATNVTGYITSGKWSRTSATTLYAEYESAGALTWNLIVNSDTTNLSTSTKTSAFTEISTSNMTDAALTGLTYSKGKKSSLTGKISTPAYDAGKYAYVTFKVADGYKFTPSNIAVKVQPVGNGEHKAVKFTLTDGSNTLASASPTKCDGTSDGKTTTVSLAGDGTYFTGTVTLKIYVYPHADATASEYNCYRLGTPITIEGEVEEACATMPSYMSMSYTTTTFAPNADASGSPITIVGGENINTYQWKYNTTNDRTSGTECGTGTSLTPLTDVASGTTRYYWCEMTNTSCGITIKSPAVAITVASAKSDASVTWTDPATPNYGGGGYTIKATVNEIGWDGNAADLVITAPAGINIYNVTSGTTSSLKWVQADFDVQTSFDRTTYASNIPFTVSAAATASYNAISNEKDVDYSACTGGGVGSSYNIRVRKSYDKDASNNYRWVTPGAGEITYAVGSSISSGKAGTAMATDFDSIMSSDKQYIWVKTFVGNIKQMRLYVETSGANVSVSALYQRTTYAAADAKDVITGYSVVYDEDDDAENTGTKGQHTIDLIFTSALSANDIICVKFSSSKVKALGAAITEGSAGSLNTYLQWSGGLANGATVNKNTTDAYFTYSASKITSNTNTLGAITYSSSNTSVATVDATGKVAMVAAGTTTIKATLAASGCYKKAEISYTLNVTEEECAIAAGTLTLTSGTESKCSSANVTLTLTGFESGAAIQWKDGDTNINNGDNYTIETDGTTSTLTTDQEGTYSVMVTSGCSVRSNRITISNKSTEVGAKRIVKNWYIKNGRLTPDIELWTLQNGAHLSSVAWDPANTTGLTASDFYESDGKVYLKGKEPSSNTSGKDIDYTLTLTVEDDCGSTTEMSASGQLIYLHHQKNTDKHVLAFVVTGTEKGGFTEGITADQTTSVELYNTIAANFDVLATNVYSTDDEQALKEYYSQFDILCVTDYPNTGTKGVNKKSYVDALGALVDIRPILTMEAFVAKLANWKAKGISGTPQSPTTRQYTMLLQCKDHEIFSGTKLTKVGEGDETMYRVSMVCDTLEDYKTLDATYGAGTHEKDNNYQYGKKPALQGFTFTKEMQDDDLLPLGLIDDGSGNDLQVGIERQTEMEARLMVLGINSYAMERLTDDGQTVVVNALKYLMKKNSEDIADCSNTFVGGDDEEDESTRSDWNVASHWSGNAVPDRTQKVRIVAPCVIPANVKPHVTGVIIAPSGKYNHGANTANGSLTIAAGGALIVDGKVEAATAPLYTETRATSTEDLTIQTSSTEQGALIFDNDKGETQATVEMYSLGRKPSSYQYQYFAVPMEVVPVNPTFANETHGGTGIYTYVYDEASSGWTRRKYYDDLFAFEGLGITTKSPDAMNYTMTGNLASTATKEITLTHDNAGLNLVGNSWMAPIQIGALAEDNTDANITQTVYIYCAGRDAVEGAATSGVTETAGQWIAIPFEAAEFETWRDAGKLSVIPAMQAFQIKVDAEATLTLDYDKVVRGSTNDLNAKLRAPGRRMAANEVTMTNIRVADSKTHTDLSLFEGDRFSEAFDNGWEAEYMNGDGRSAKLYAETEAGQMAVAAMYDYEGTVVGFAPGKETEYTFSFMGEDNGYYLNDIKLQNSVRISEGETYTFTYEEGDAANRFYISRTPIDAPQTSTGVDNTGNGEVKARKFIYRDKMYILINGRVYSADGALVK